MLTKRLVLAASVAALVLPALPASAGKACELVKDKSGDAVIGFGGVGVPAPAFDVLSFDVATGRKTLVAVLRVASTDVKADPAATTGIRWAANFSIAGVHYRFTRSISAAGAVTDAATANDTAISGVSINVAAKSVTWTAPRAVFPALKKSNAVIDGLFAQTSSPLSYDNAPDNGAPSTVTYKDRTPSCVSAP